MSKRTGSREAERYTPPLALRQIVDNLTFTRERVTVWYLLAPQAWSFRSDAQCTAVLLAQAQRISQLVGKRVHMRVTTRPYPVRRWAQALDAITPNPLPGIPGDTWADHLVAEQRHLEGRTLADKEVYVGLELASRGTTDRLLARLWRRAAEREAAAFDKQLRPLDKLVAGPGFEGRPATAKEMEWLMHRSVCLGMPAPFTLSPIEDGRWETTDLAEFTDRAQWHAEPYARTVQVTGELAGRQISRHICVLTLGRMAPLSIPESADEPWMQRTDRLPFPVEWKATYEVREPGAVTYEMQDQIKRIRSQQEHYEVEHHTPAPLSLDRQARRALEIEDELQSGFDGLSTRVRGWFRVAVSGRTEEEALERAQQVIDLYSPKITVVRPADQFKIAREFVPGEPLANTAYARRMPVTTLAAALPAATASVGDRRGVYVGTTCGASERAVMWDPWLATEVREQSGLCPVIGGLGAGKSNLGGLLVYKNVRRGIPWVVLDPSARLGALCDLPEIAAHARHINLLNADPGTLNPYRVVAEPRRQHFADEEDPERAWRRAAQQAQAYRRALCTDVLRSLLPAQLDDMPATQIVLLKAVRAVGGSYTASPRDVIAALRGMNDDHAETIAEALDEAADMPQAWLFFPAGYQLDYDRETDAAYCLTVLSLKGLVMPQEGTPRKDWTLEERFSVPLLNLAAWLTQRSIYEGDVHQRKGVFFDETQEFSRISSGRALLNRTSRDSRKHNTRALMASQNGRDMLVADIGNFISGCFVGRTTDPQAQADALQMLGVDPGAGYEQVLAGLSPQDRRSESRSGFREFVFNDGDGGIEKIRIDLDGLPRLRAALDTTADPGKVRALAGGRNTEDAA